MCQSRTEGIDILTVLFERYVRIRLSLDFFDHENSLVLIQHYALLKHISQIFNLSDFI